MAATTPLCDFGWKAVDFALPGTDGKTWRLADVAGPRGTLIMFVCNHCPYVKAVAERIVRDTRALMAEGIGAAAIMSNDTAAYPQDSFANMKRFARQHDFPFPYLLDESQDVARAYGAVCTPDFFGFDKDLGLQYRGRLDASRNAPARPDAQGHERRELFEAMRQIECTGKGPKDQEPSMGCSIKWRAAA